MDYQRDRSQTEPVDHVETGSCGKVTERCPDRRNAERFFCENGTRGMLVAIGDSMEGLAIKVIDVSASGVRVSCAARVPHQTCVELILDDCLLLGEVVFCNTAANGFDLGIKLEQWLRSETVRNFANSRASTAKGRDLAP